MLPFTERAVKIIKEIPAGRVMTYGQVASAAGNPRGARQISRILHSMSAKYELPWHRIINAQGGISTQLMVRKKADYNESCLKVKVWNS
ncbi:MGMT family protein [Sporosarcina thermotolerans]|uniref:MGMT family protein n=1 Tax=Sporosarcina thermotolerans TaxID=633404 RepID=UPI003D2F5AFA